MSGFAIFLLRGALGAIVGTVTLALLFTFYTRYFLVLMVALAPVLIAVQAAFGMLIGFVCWVAAGDVRRLNVFLRVAIGTGITWVAVLALYLYPLVTGREDFSNLSVIDILQFQFFLLVVSLSIGGAAGLACPATREYQAQAHLSYRERVELYEAAEREAKEARERIASVSLSRGQS